MWSIKRIKAKNVISFESLEFDIQNGVATPIVGQNLDDLGQEANGAGKSALFEIISMALTGDSMRKVSVKENIQDGFDEAFVEVELSNKTTSSTLLISRTFRAKKSTMVSIGLNGKVPTIKTSDSGDLDAREANDFILTTIGITREDIFNYYLISQQNFVSFLQASDTKKKEIISRFSNTRTIDNVIAYIENEHILPLNDKISFVEQEQVAINAKICVRKEQLEELNEGEFEQVKKEMINQLKENIEAANYSIKKHSSSISVIKENVIEVEEKIVVENQFFQVEESLLNKISERHNKQNHIVSELEGVFKKERETRMELKTGKIRVFLAEAKTDDKVQESEITKIKSEIKLIENRLLGSIICPECDYEFKLGENTSTKDLLIMKQKLKSSLQEAEQIAGKISKAIKNSMNELDKAILSVSVELDKSRYEIDVQKDKISEIKGEFRIQESKITDIKRDIRNKKNTIEDLTRSIKATEGSIDQEKNAIEDYIRAIELEEQKTLSSKKSEIESKIEKLDDDYVNKINELGNISEEKLEYDNWILNFMKFKTRLANNSIKTIETFANFYLGKMKSNIRIRIDGYKTLSSGQVREKIATTVFRDGIEKGSYGKFSAGERARIDIAITVALQSIINSASTSGGLNMLFMDEILDAVDTLGLKSITNALQNIGVTIMIVTQNTIDQLGEGCLLVQKNNGNSKILIR